MSEKRTRTVFTERYNQEGLHARLKGPISALNELMKDAAFAKHRKILDEVAKAMTRALENDQKWAMRFKMLQAELDSNESRMKIALELSERDKNVIVSLQNELKTAWNTVEELKTTMKDYSQQNFLENSIGKENSEEMKEKKTVREKSDENVRNSFNTDEDRETKRKAKENEKLLKEMIENQDKLQNDIERTKLQVFELEEEMTNKEKCIEELTNALNSKLKHLDNITAENIELKKLLEEVKPTDNSETTENYTEKPNANKPNNKEQKRKKAITDLKKKLRDISKRDQISLEKVKHLIKKNQILSKQLQINKNHNNLLKLELAEQTKMLDMLACQFCKLEQTNKKQAALIAELENVRNKYMNMVGNLEQEIHEMKKKVKF